MWKRKREIVKDSGSERQRKINRVRSSKDSVSEKKSIVKKERVEKF